MEPQFFIAKSADGTRTHRLAYYDRGPIEDTRPIICVHGLTRNARDFDALAEALASQGRRVIAISMAGRGESEWLSDPMEYTYATYVADCIAFLDNFHFRQVDWIGTSMGGIIGMTIAGLLPGRIKKLLLNDIGARLNRAALERIFTNVRSMPARFTTREEAMAYLHRAYVGFGLTESEWPSFADISLQPLEGCAWRLACDPRIVEPLARDTKQFTEINDIDLAELWKKVEAPTLILRGSESDILDPETVRAMRGIHLETETITIPNVGHAPALMSPEQIAIVAGWLSRDRMGVRLAGL